MCLYFMSIQSCPKERLFNFQRFRDLGHDFLAYGIQWTCKYNDNIMIYYNDRMIYSEKRLRLLHITYFQFNYTGCEITQSCFEDKCYNATVCICEVCTECPKIYRKSVLHLLNYRFSVNFGTLSMQSS